MQRSTTRDLDEMAVASNKRVVYVGGLAEEVNEKVIQVLEALLKENQGPKL